MSDATIVMLALGLGTYALKAAGPILLTGRTLPPWMSRVADLAPGALLAALVATSTFEWGDGLRVDARLIGMAAAALALRLKAPFIVVVVIAAAVTALARTLP